MNATDVTPGTHKNTRWVMVRSQFLTPKEKFDNSA
jgi:hypothetical protein